MKVLWKYLFSFQDLAVELLLLLIII